jgi:hypothetical protein
VDGTPTPAPVEAAVVAPGSRGCPAPEPESHWRTVTVQPPLCRGRYEGTETFLGRRGPPKHLAAIAASTATEPPDVCGADTLGPHQHVEMKSAHATRRRLRRTKEHHQQVETFPLIGQVCLLTTGGLIRVILPPRPLLISELVLVCLQVSVQM